MAKDRSRDAEVADTRQLIIDAALDIIVSAGTTQATARETIMTCPCRMIAVRGGVAR